MARLITGTGAGWGDPRRWPVDKVRADVEVGYVSAEAARAVYGRDLLHG